MEIKSIGIESHHPHSRNNLVIPELIVVPIPNELYNRNTINYQFQNQLNWFICVQLYICLCVCVCVR